MQRGTHTHANTDRYSHRNCDAHSPTPTPTPTPEPTATPTPAATPESTATSTLSPTEIVHAAACGQGVPSAVDAVISVVDLDTADEPYDLAQPDIRHNVRTDGDSFESHDSIAAQGDYPGGNNTVIIKGDYKYIREDTEPWRVNYIRNLRAPPPTCDGANQASGAAGTEPSATEPSATDTVLRALGGPAEGEYEYRGEVTLNGVLAKHYVRVGPGPASGAANAGAAGVSNPAPTPTPRPRYAYLNKIYDEVWINAEGHFVQVEGSRPRVGISKHLRFRVDYSGHGEPNAITAPFAVPVITEREVFSGRAANVQLPAALNGSGDITYSLSPALPSGLTFNASTRTITGTPAATADPSEYTLTRRCGGLTATQSFPLRVSATPDSTHPITSENRLTARCLLNILQLTRYHASASAGADPQRFGTNPTALGTPTVATSAIEYTTTVTSPVEIVQDIFSMTIVEPTSPPAPTPTPTPTPTP